MASKKENTGIFYVNIIMVFVVAVLVINNQLQITGIDSFFSTGHVTNPVQKTLSKAGSLLSGSKGGKIVGPMMNTDRRTTKLQKIQETRRRMQSIILYQQEHHSTLKKVLALNCSMALHLMIQLQAKKYGHPFWVQADLEQKVKLSSQQKSRIDTKKWSMDSHATIAAEDLTK